MARINIGRVVIGGLVAGAVLGAVDIVTFGMVLKAPMAVAMRALPKPRMVDVQVPWYLLIDLLAGIGLVWLYAALRPRFGAGPGTAARAGAAGWFFVSLVPTLVMWPMNLMPLGLTVITTGIALVQWPLAAVVGARFYRE
ncbi:MAG TPA: hypothetical protein VI160_07850 [Gemmatimonadales bacterium]